MVQHEVEVNLTGAEVSKVIELLVDEAADYQQLKWDNESLVNRNLELEDKIIKLEKELSDFYHKEELKRVTDYYDKEELKK